MMDKIPSTSPSSIEHQMSIDHREEEHVVVSTKYSNIRDFCKQHRHILKKEVRELCKFHPNEWRDAFRRNPVYPIFRKGDIDGLVALFIDNMATLLTIILSLESVLDTDILYGRIVPG
jgi:hypothetical protein